MSKLSLAKFNQFVNQARGQNVHELHVNRQDRRKEILLRYNGKAPKKKRRR